MSRYIYLKFILRVSAYQNPYNSYTLVTVFGLIKKKNYKLGCENIKIVEKVKIKRTYYYKFYDLLLLCGHQSLEGRERRF